MKAEAKQQWLDALRSGKYTQGRSLLRTQQDEFCCLGVLCDLVEPNGWERAELDRYEHGGYIGHLPPDIRRRVSLSDDQSFTLMGMNDNGQSFAQIADWIEANIPAES